MNDTSHQLALLDVRAALDGDAVVLHVRRTQKLRARAIRLAIRPDTDSLVRHLADVVRGSMSADEARQMIARDPALVEQSLALARLAAGQGTQQHNAGVDLRESQIDELTITNAAGHDINHITINIIVEHD